MKLKEKIYCAIFITTVIGATVLLNLPKKKLINNNSFESKDIAHYNSLSSNKVISIDENSINIDGGLDINYALEGGRTTLFWERPETGEYNYILSVNKQIVKKVKSKGKGLYYTIDNSNFISGANSITILGVNSKNKSVAGNFYFNLQVIRNVESEEISLLE